MDKRAPSMGSQNLSSKLMHSQSTHREVQKGGVGVNHKNPNFCSNYFIQELLSSPCHYHRIQSAGVEQQPRDQPVPAASKGPVKSHKGELYTSMPEG